MNDMHFEWDPQKASLNIKKHLISFDEAKSAFYDEHALIIHDPEHSQDEDRFVLLGKSTLKHLLVVCHCYRKNNTTIRIISARKATRKETSYYYGD